MINPQRVEEIFRDSLYDVAPDDMSKVNVLEGITMKVGFQPDKLERNRQEIWEMLDQLPDQFKLSKGGGHSFLAACEDKHGEQWTGLHLRMEQLFLLGMGLDLVRCNLPRQYWPILHAGMPYYVVLDEPWSDEKDLLKILEAGKVGHQEATEESQFKFNIFDEPQN